MILKVFVFVTILLSLINFNSGLTCHGCITSTTSDCVKGVESSYFINKCVPQANLNNVSRPSLSGLHLKTRSKTDENRTGIKTVCVRFAYKDHSDVFVRGCGYIYENVDICKYLEATVNTIGCSWCDGDFCNSQPGWD